MFSRPSLVRALIRTLDRAVGVSAGPHESALQHLRAGRPLEATALIQRSLAGAGPSLGRWGRPSRETGPRTVGTTTRGPFGAAGPSSRRGGECATPSPEGAVTRGTWRGAAGTLGYRVFVPSRRHRSPAPLMVMLHGGTQDAETFAAATGMDEVAEREGFLVVYPEQSRSANPLGYWNWFRPGDQHRDAGEPSSIAGITRAVAAEHDVDPDAVAVMGFSAGAAMAAVLAATYPDLYTAAGVHSGLAPGAARDVRSAFAAMRSAPPVSDGPVLRVPLLVFHGDRDDTVAVGNATRVVESAVGNRPTSSTTTGREPGGRQWTRQRWCAPDGRVLVESWTVHGAGHAWSGGRAGGSYVDPAGPDASTAMVAFCGFLRPDDTSTT